MEGSKKVLKEMQDDVSSLRQRVISYSVSIEQLETQSGQISVHLNYKSKRGTPSDTMVNLNNDVFKQILIVPQHSKRFFLRVNPSFSFCYLNNTCWMCRLIT